jgi:hypothetical protein
MQLGFSWRGTETSYHVLVPHRGAGAAGFSTHNETLYCSVMPDPEAGSEDADVEGSA